jgi:hypothetical protein
MPLLEKLEEGKGLCAVSRQLLRFALRCHRSPVDAMPAQS